ncbi:MAG: PKD domain-containing protein [Myxococcota bacterium]
MITERATEWPSNVVIEVYAGENAPFNQAEIRTAPTSTTPTAYAWDWGDGTTAGSGATTNHPYKNPGTYRLRLDLLNGTTVFETYYRTVVVGVRTQDIPALATTTDVYFEAVVLVRLQRPDGATVLALVPLLAASQPYVSDTTSVAVRPQDKDFLDLAGRLQSVYAHRALMLPIPEPDLLPDGLYLLFPRDVVYAGTSSALTTLQQKLRRDWRQIDVEESLYDLRAWAIAEAAFANTSGLAYANENGAPVVLPAVIDPTMGGAWLAPGLGGFGYDAVLADNTANDQVVPELSLTTGQSVVSPLQAPPRYQALRWLAVVGSGLCAVVRRFGEDRGLRYTAGPVDYPGCLFAWNTRDATLAWSVIGQSDKAGTEEEDPRIQVQNYWACGAMTFGLSREDAERQVPDLDAMNLVSTCKARQVLGDAAVRAMVGDDRELGDHVVQYAGRTYGVRMRTGEVFLPSGPKSETVAGGVHVIGRFWAGWPTSTIPADPPLLRMPSVAEAVTGDGGDLDEVVVARGLAPSSSTRSGLALDAGALVSRYRMRRGGEVRVAARSYDSAITGTLGPTALSQLDRTTDEVAPLRNPLRNVAGGGGGCGGGCGG